MHWIKPTVTWCVNLLIDNQESLQAKWDRSVIQWNLSSYVQLISEVTKMALWRVRILIKMICKHSWTSKTYVSQMQPPTGKLIIICTNQKNFWLSCTDMIETSLSNHIVYQLCHSHSFKFVHDLQKQSSFPLQCFCFTVWILRLHQHVCPVSPIFLNFYLAISAYWVNTWVTSWSRKFAE